MRHNQSNFLSQMKQAEQMSVESNSRLIAYLDTEGVRHERHGDEIHVEVGSFEKFKHIVEEIANEGSKG